MFYGSRVLFVHSVVEHGAAVHPPDSCKATTPVELVIDSNFPVPLNLVATRSSTKVSLVLVGASVMKGFPSSLLTDGIDNGGKHVFTQ